MPEPIAPLIGPVTDMRVAVLEQLVAELYVALLKLAPNPLAAAESLVAELSDRVGNLVIAASRHDEGPWRDELIEGAARLNQFVKNIMAGFSEAVIAATVMEEAQGVVRN